MADSHPITPYSSAGALKEQDSHAFRSSSGPAAATTTTTTTDIDNPLGAGEDSEKPIKIGQFGFMAIGGSIGAGLFFGSGQALLLGGPGAVVLVFAVLGLAVWLTMCALSELVCDVPARGSFYDYSVRLVSESWGFAMGWNYVVNFMLIVGFEITVIVRTLKYWYGEDVDIVAGGLIAAVPVCQVLLALGQVWGPAWYGDVERVFSVVKVTTLMVFNVVAVVIAVRHGGSAFENYQNGQAFQNGIKGLMSVLITAGMAYGGTEMLGFNAVACYNPGRAMRLTPWIVALRIATCYCFPLFLVGLILSPSALRDAGGVSPFVAAVHDARIPVLPDLINGALAVSILSMANASVFASSRALAAICARGMGPRPLGAYARLGCSWRWVPKARVPWRALAVVAVWSMLAWIVAAEKGMEIFEWLLSLAGVSNLFTWVSIDICHIRLRWAVKIQGHGTAGRGWRAPWGVLGSYLAAGLIILTILAQVATSVLSPVPGDDTPYVTHLMRGILGFICVLLLYLGHLSYVVWRGDKSWREMLLIPLDKIALPETQDAIGSPAVVYEEKGSQPAVV